MENDHSFRYSRETWWSETIYIVDICVVLIFFFFIWLSISSLSLTPFIFVKEAEGRIYTFLRLHFIRWAEQIVLSFHFWKGITQRLAPYANIQGNHYMLFDSLFHSFLLTFFGVWCLIDPCKAWLLLSVLLITSTVPFFRKILFFPASTWNVKVFSFSYFWQGPKLCTYWEYMHMCVCHSCCIRHSSPQNRINRIYVGR